MVENCFGTLLAELMKGSFSLSGWAVGYVCIKRWFSILKDAARGAVIIETLFYINKLDLPWPKNNACRPLKVIQWCYKNLWSLWSLNIPSQDILHSAFPHYGTYHRPQNWIKRKQHRKIIKRKHIRKSYYYYYAETRFSRSICKASIRVLGHSQEGCIRALLLAFDGWNSSKKRKERKFNKTMKIYFYFNFASQWFEIVSLSSVLICYWAEEWALSEERIYTCIICQFAYVTAKMWNQKK